MALRICIDGEVHDQQTATISVLDRGFLYGDSVYEVMRTSGGRVVDEARHLERLDRSAAAIALPSPAAALWRADMASTLAAAANPESYLRLVLTRGSGEIGLDPALAEHPRRIVIVKPLPLPPPALYARGAHVVVVGVRRNPREALDPAVKSGNYLNNILGLAEARRAGADESIMCNPRGVLVEGSSSNVFVVRGGRVRTPALDGGLLDGITRRRVIELAGAAGLPVDEAELLPDDLRAADEAFITSSIRGVMPVTRVDGRAVGDGQPGRVTRALLAAYDDFLSAVARGEL